VAENINSVSVECREARFEFVNIDFKVAETTGDNHPIQIAQGHTFWGTWGHWFQFDRYVGYYKQDSFAGWSFPKYNNPTSAEIPNWWDPSAIFSSFNVPKMGAYPISYRRWNAENPPIYELLTNCLLVKCYNDSSSMLGYNKKYMIYSKQLNAGKGDYIMIDGQFAMSFFAGDANQWYSKSKGNWIIDYRQRAGVWNAGETPKSINNNNWDQCVVPVSPNHENSPLLEGICKSFDWVRISIQFGSLWYNNITDSFTSSTENIFPLSVDGDGLYPNNFYPLQTKKPAADETPKFENVSGFWVELPKGYGTLTVNFYFPNTKTSSPSEVVNYSLLISDLKIQKLNVSSDNYAFTKLNKVYEVGDVSNTVNELKNLKYTVYLGSLKQDNPELFLSTMYSDMAGKNPIDKLDYSINIPSGGSFSISEKPETHLCRIAYYYFTRMKTITDMINIKDRQLTYTYNSKKLWENGCDISPLNDTITVQYNYNDTTYDS
jgi:hypothetical protein